MGTQVITRDTGRRLGVVGEVMVDIDRREVVALGLRDNPLTRFLPGLPRWMPLESIRQVGDVILVDSADSLSETFQPERYSKVINCQVVTESGAQLGRVLGFSFDIETGELTTLVIGALGVPLLGEGVLSTWELPVGEIVSSGTDRIIVYEGAEEKLKQLGTGLLEKLGIGGSSWEQEERERFRSGAIPAENQLPAGQPIATEQRRIQPASSRAVQPQGELDYVELEERREREPLRQRRYLDEESAERPERLQRGGYDEPEREPPAYRDWPRESRAFDRGDQRSPADDRDTWQDRGAADRQGEVRYQPDRYGADRGASVRSQAPGLGRLGGELPQREPVGREPEQDLGPRRLRREPEAEERSAAYRDGMAAFPDRDDWASQRSAPERDRQDNPEPLPRSRPSSGETDRSDGDRRDREPWELPTRRPRPAADPGTQEPLDVEAEVLDDPW
jgi:sporulation protein YlmC with PRC-barrel domain